MKFIKLDSNTKGWTLGKVSLYDYISSLTTEKFNYAIQRGVVTNPYLDTILDAVIANKPLSPVSLTATIENGNNIIEYNILDGLQRTCRLWIYYQLSQISLDNNITDYRKATDKLKTYCDFYSKAVAPRQVRKLFNSESDINVWNLKEKYSNYYLYLYIWQGLTPDEEIKAMLILNAGQQRMSIAHQYEIMYLRLFENYRTGNSCIKLLRAKDNVGNAQRQVGEYKIPTIIIGIQSLLAGKPMRLTRETFLYKDYEYDDSENIYIQSADYLFTKDFIEEFLAILYDLDRKICVSNELCSWFGKDTTISGIMAGIGSSSSQCTNPTELLDTFKQAVDKIKNPQMLNLEEYEKAYSNLSSVKVNIGTIVRKAITLYIRNLITSKDPISWASAFGKYAK